MNWKTILTTVCTLAMVAYLVFAFVALSKPAEDKVCRELRVGIEESSVGGFLSPSEICTMLTADNLSPVGRALDNVDLGKIERALEAKELIEKAECYTMLDSIVMVEVKQRIPVVHVINSVGENYYVDTHGLPMPASIYTRDLLVATGNISRSYAKNALAPMANKIQADPFWRSEIVQLNILHDGSVELIPRVGNHVVYLGQPTGISKKLERLRKFYLYGLNVAGWNKYSRVSVEFDNQIICKRNKK